MVVNGCTNLASSPAMPATRGHRASPRPSRWGIVLAGGDGARMRSLISNWLGEDRPKQYCAFVGHRSMFEHTIDRACSVVSGEHVVTVIGRDHRRFLDESTDRKPTGLILEQPSNRGTAPGVLLATAFVLAADPEATVVLLPSDHFVHPESRFCDHLNRAFELAEKHKDMLILVAAIPDRAETEYGWIDPGGAQMAASSTLPRRPANVKYFREKPSENEARSLFQRGCLWSTMVVAVKARTLWRLAREYLPETSYRFEAFLSVLSAVREERLGARHEGAALIRLYKELAAKDFSKDLLQRVPHLSKILPMDGVDWCDWGHPRRLTETLARLGQRPLYEAKRLGPAQAGAIAREGRGA